MDERAGDEQPGADRRSGDRRRNADLDFGAAERRRGERRADPAPRD